MSYSAAPSSCDFQCSVCSFRTAFQFQLSHHEATHRHDEQHLFSSLTSNAVPCRRRKKLQVQKVAGSANPFSGVDQEVLHPTDLADRLENSSCVDDFGEKATPGQASYRICNICDALLLESEVTLHLESHYPGNDDPVESVTDSDSNKSNDVQQLVGPSLVAREKQPCDKCNFCRKAFSSFANSDRHRKLHRRNWINSSELLKSIFKHVSGSVRKCSLVLRRLQRKKRSSLLSRLRKQTETELYLCKNCDSLFSSYRVLVRHMKSGVTCVRSNGRLNNTSPRSPSPISFEAVDNQNKDEIANSRLCELNNGMIGLAVPETLTPVQLAPASNIEKLKAQFQDVKVVLTRLSPSAMNQRRLTVVEKSLKLRETSEFIPEKSEVPLRCEINEIEPGDTTTTEPLVLSQTASGNDILVSSKGISECSVIEEQAAISLDNNKSSIVQAVTTSVDQLREVSSPSSDHNKSSAVEVVKRSNQFLDESSSPLGSPLESREERFEDNSDNNSEPLVSERFFGVHQVVNYLKDTMETYTSESFLQGDLLADDDTSTVSLLQPVDPDLVQVMMLESSNPDPLMSDTMINIEEFVFERDQEDPQDDPTAPEQEICWDSQTFLDQEVSSNVLDPIFSDSVVPDYAVVVEVESTQLPQDQDQDISDLSDLSWTATQVVEEISFEDELHADVMVTELGTTTSTTQEDPKLPVCHQSLDESPPRRSLTFRPSQYIVGYKFETYPKPLYWKKKTRIRKVPIRRMGKRMSPPANTKKSSPVPKFKAEPPMMSKEVRVVLTRLSPSAIKPRNNQSECVKAPELKEVRVVVERIKVPLSFKSIERKLAVNGKRNAAHRIKCGNLKTLGRLRRKALARMKRINCPSCFYRTIFFSALRVHLKSHLRNTKFSCKDCEFDCEDLKEYNQHMKYIHNYAMSYV